ncbi:MAG TPA: hypothetical protein VFH27_07700 [Longimicrobiaceae bacterium]|nr:hypothetical protein [Longimicrobiaceae bacterium]
MHPAPADTARRDSAVHVHHPEPAAPAMDHAGMAGMAGMDAMPGMAGGPLGIPMTRMGSGTSWLPDVSPMHAKHFMLGGWEAMVHGVAYGYFVRQNGPRGAEQWGSSNWAMLMAGHPLAGGRLQLHGMFSAEPWTVKDGGYPLLLQTGETYGGQPLHDRQHPHDLFMELAALYERPVAENLAIELYGGPVGEPALGPVAFPHRPSAMNDPLAPLGHHWQDATHISFGVVTAGLFSRTWKAEASLFNGREPDEDRTDFDMGRLDSYSGRLSYNPSAAWSFSASAGYLHHAERLGDHTSLRRYGVSAMHGRAFGTAGQWNSAFTWGANQHVGEGGLESAWLAETNLDLDARNSVFARAEYVTKGAEDLVLGAAPPAESFRIASISGGYVHDLLAVGGLSAGLGVRGSVSLVPRTLEPFYGSRTPTGWSIYVRLRPATLHGGAGATHGTSAAAHSHRQ